MLEYILIFAVVGLSAWVVGKKLWRQLTRGTCDDCSHKNRNPLPPRLIQIKPVEKDER